jgi:hypothetical protein
MERIRKITRMRNGKNRKRKKKGEKIVKEKDLTKREM